MRRHAVTVGILLALLLLIVAMSALAQTPDQWPPSEMSQQDPGHGPLTVPPSPPPTTDPSPPRATVDAAPEGADTVGSDFLGWVWALIKYGGTALTSGVAVHGYHVTCRRDELRLSTGPMDVSALRTDVQENTALLREVKPLLEALPSANPPSSSPPPFKPPPPRRLSPGSPQDAP